MPSDYYSGFRDSLFPPAAAMVRVLTFLLALLTLTGALLYAFPAPTLPYGAGVFVHVVAGLLTLLVMLAAVRRLRGQSLPARLGWLALMVSAVLGVALLKTGGTLPFRPLLYAHISASLLAIVLLVSERLGRAGWLGPAALRYPAVALLTAAVALILLLG